MKNPGDNHGDEWEEVIPKDISSRGYFLCKGVYTSIEDKEKEWEIESEIRRQIRQARKSKSQVTRLTKKQKARIDELKRK